MYNKLEGRNDLSYGPWAATLYMGYLHARSIVSHAVLKTCLAIQ